MRPYRVTHPPPALRRATLDNLALVPGNLLPLKAQWQQLANALPKGDVLIVLPSTDSPQRKTLEALAARLEARGHRVTTLPAERFS